MDCWDGFGKWGNGGVGFGVFRHFMNDHIAYRNRLNLKILNQTKTEFIHFEKYNHRFQWNKSSLIIDIYLPFNTNK